MDCLTNALATGDGNLDLPEHVEDLFRAVSFPGIPASLQNAQYLIFQLETFKGGRSDLVALVCPYAEC